MDPRNYLYRIIISGLVALLTTVLPLQPAHASGVSPSLVMSLVPDVFITEVQTATAASASEEFIELYNNTAHDIDFADSSHGKKDIWKIQYFSGSKLTAASGVSDWTLPTGAIDLSVMDNTVIPAHDYYLLAASKSDGSVYQPGGIAADGHYSAKLSDNVGLQLVDVMSSTAVTTAHDRVIWQTSATAPGVLPAPSPDNSLQRIPNSDDEYVDETGGLTSMQAKAPISPRDLWIAPSVPDSIENDPEDETSNSAATDTSPLNQATDDGVKPPTITELLPNPASPQTDAKDEFIELYNPNSSALDVSGYSLETGTTTLHDFTFASGSTLAANTYQAFYSVDTHLSLTNNGGQVRLLAPDKTKIAETTAYSTAPDGQAWALINGAWLWSSLPTPNQANTLANAGLLSQPVSKTEKTKAKVKGTNTTKTKTVKVKKAKAVKAKKKKIKKTATIKPASAQLASAIKPTPIHTGVLAAIAVAAVLYALYEYRVDLANYIYRFRSHHPFRRSTRR